MSGVFDKLNTQRAALRDAIAFALANPGKGAEGDPGAYSLHEAWMQDAAHKMSKNLRPGATRAVLSGAGKANEMLSGLLALLGGHDFYSEEGYDEGDIAANRRGIEAGLAKQDPLPALRYLAGLEQ